MTDSRFPDSGKNFSQDSYPTRDHVQQQWEHREGDAWGGRPLNTALDTTTNVTYRLFRSSGISLDRTRIEFRATPTLINPKMEHFRAEQREDGKWRLSVLRGSIWAPIPHSLDDLMAILIYIDTWMN